MYKWILNYLTVNKVCNHKTNRIKSVTLIPLYYYSLTYLEAILQYISTLLTKQNRVPGELEQRN